jgi:predicted kinase
VETRRQVVVQMHGEPGSGKSAIARVLGERLGAVVLDKDVIKAALLRSGIAERDAASGAYEVYFTQARAFVAAGHSVVLDNPVFWESAERRWLDLTAFAGSPAVLIECVCPDREELVRRLATREALESQPREPLDLVRHPGSAATTFEPRLTLDTTRPLDDLVAEALAYVRHLTPRPPLRDAPAPPPTDGRRPATAPR